MAQVRTGLRDRPKRSMKSWCIHYANRWQISSTDLINGMYGKEVIVLPQQFQLRIECLHQLGELLDQLLPLEMQWHFWFRPTHEQPTPPICRLGCGGEPEDVAHDLIRELHVLLERAAPCGSAPSSRLKLFLPVMMFKYIDWSSGSVSTRLELDETPLSWNPLTFPAGAYAKDRSSVPGQAARRA
jgi:hypothetical protein